MYDEWISYWAKRSPQNVAVVLPAGPVGYAEFDGLINKVAARLDTLALPAGSRVAVHVADEYVHWLLVLALDRLGLGSASIGMVRPDNPFLAALGPQLILTADKGRAGTVEISKEWLDETRRLPPCGRPARRAA